MLMVHIHVSSSGVNNNVAICATQVSQFPQKLLGHTLNTYLVSYQRGLPDVVVLTEDHASFAVAGAAVLAQLSLAAGALEAARVPVPLHREEQEAVCDSTSTSCTRPARLHPTAAHHCHCGRLHPAVHHSDLETDQEST